MEEIIVMTKKTIYWGTPRWKVYEVNEKGTGEGPVIGSPPANTKDGAIKMFRLANEDRKLRPGRTHILVLSPNWGPTERWLKENWY